MRRQVRFSKGTNQLDTRSAWEKEGISRATWYRNGGKSDGTTRMGGPVHQPTEQTRRMVETMAACGILQPDIARVLGMSDDTLRTHYREELDTAATKANSMVAQTLYQQAVGGPGPRPDWSKSNVTAAIWWTKTRMKWKETNVLENQNSGTINLEVSARERVRSRIASISERLEEEEDPRLIDGA
jgi:hypothetical protein